MRPPLRARLFALAPLALFATSLWAQVTTGTLAGTVKDPSGAPVAGATVTLRHLPTSAVRTVPTDQGGRYRAAGLPPGPYELRAEAPGFQAARRSGFEVQVGSELVADFLLSLGARTETVEIHEIAPLVDTTRGSLSYVVDEHRIQDLPLNGRDITQLILIQPGVVLSRNSNNSANVGQGLKISVAGSRPSQNLFTLDGTAANDALNSTPASAGGVVTGVETIKEFRVVTNSMSAAYGRAAGGVFNVVTKSGTNEWHGSAFEFFRDDSLDARGYFDVTKPDFRRHQFGGSLGGPIARDRTFVFVSYEGLRETKGITQVATVPDDEARRGLLPGRAPIAIPATIRPYLDLFPLANGEPILDAGGRRTGVAEYRGVLRRDSDQDFAMARVDHVFDRGSAFVRYLFDDSVRDEPLNFPQFPNLTRNRKHVITAEARRAFASGAINELRVGWSRSTPREDVNPEDPHTEVAFVPGQPFGELAVTGLTEIGTDRSNPKAFGQDLFQVTDNVYAVRGRHALQAGFDVQHFRFDGFSDSRSRGRLRFRSVADFLSGVTQQFEVAKPGSDFERHYRQTLFGAYVQDDFRPVPRLVLNLGLRWEFVTTPEERDGKVSNLRDNADPEVTVGGPLFQNATKSQLAPRLGVVWDARGDGRTLLRGGFGVFHEEPLFSLYRSPIFRAVPFVDRAVIARPALPVTLATLASAGPPETESIVYDMRSAYTLQFNAGVQQALPLHAALSVSYVGSRGRNLFGQGDTNTAVPQMVGGREFFPAGSSRRNPNFGANRTILQGFHSQYDGLQVSLVRRRVSGLQAQASYTLGRAMDDRSGGGGRQEWRNGQSRTFDPYDFDRDWARADFDVRHTATFDASWDLPLGGSRLAEGWQVNVLGTVASGVPFTPIIPGDPDRDGSSDNPARPDVVPGVSTVPAGGRTATQWFNPAAFAYPGAGFRGNAGRNIIDGPGYAVMDLSVVKTQRLSARARLQLRVDVFNVFNRANLDIPLNDPDGAAVFDEAGQRLPDAGKIFTTVGDPREVQFAVRLLF